VALLAILGLWPSSRRTCGCGQVTTAPAPAGVTGGPVCYGPNVTDAATLLASMDVIGVERAADLMGALLKAPVSTGFVSRCLVRLEPGVNHRRVRGRAQRRAAAGGRARHRRNPRPSYQRGRLRQPARLHGADHAGLYRRRAGPHLVRRGREPHQGVDHRFRDPGRLPRALVRDDYGGYLSYDAGLTGVQQCLAHLYRYLDDAYATDPESQVWTRQAGDALRAASAAVRTARDARQAGLDPALLAGLRHSYDQAVACGISVNLSRRWHKGNHPGLILARRLKRKAAQVWLFATRFDVPATNNGSENAVRGYKLAAKISGCWRTLSTLQRHCRIRSYLTTARSHGRHPFAAIRDALTENTWMPPHPA
jgi:transposase